MTFCLSAGSVILNDSASQAICLPACMLVILELTGMVEKIETAWAPWIGQKLPVNIRVSQNVTFLKKKFSRSVFPFLWHI